MKSLLLLLPLLAMLPLVFSAPLMIDPSQPIYIGDVFWPPVMTFMAWLAGDEKNFLTEWCWKGMDATDNKLFSLGGIDALQIHDYFAATGPYITREGNRFANCFVTPTSGRMGVCDAAADRECESPSKQKFQGPGFRGFSCWVIESEWTNLLGERLVRHVDIPRGEYFVTGDSAKPTPVGINTQARGGEGVKAAFTPGATGRS